MVETVLPHAVVSAVSIGLAVAFYLADRRAPTSRALSLTLLAIGLSMLFNVVMVRAWSIPVGLAGWFALPESLAMVGLLEWISRVRRTVPSGDLRVTVGDRLLRVGQVLAVVYSLLSVLFPAQRSEAFLAGLGSVATLHEPAFWAFMVPVGGVALCAIGSLSLLLRRQPDRPERYRVLAMIAAIPFMVAGFVLPLAFSALAMTLGLMVFLVGAMQYHVMQGQRGQFLAQFLSPQVAELVSRRGLRTAMKERFLELSSVYVDLRGYTAVAEGAASSRVMRILRDYYGVVGRVVAEYQATIKDQAGDGILILVGAPIEVPDHAQRSLSLARRLRDELGALAAQWSREGIWLGVGIGVATGPVTVGVIGSGGRLEYTAVGASVNLSARLCQTAADGEVLVSERTVEIAGLQSARMGLEVRSPQRFKGFSEPQGYFALAAA